MSGRRFFLLGVLAVLRFVEGVAHLLGRGFPPKTLEMRAKEDGEVSRWLVRNVESGDGLFGSLPLVLDFVLDGNVSDMKQK